MGMTDVYRAQVGRRMNESNETAPARTAGRYVVWVMAAIVIACLGLAISLANRATPEARKFQETHSPQP